jgi:hypothetical protein
MSQQQLAEENYYVSLMAADLYFIEQSNNSKLLRE